MGDVTPDVERLLKIMARLRDPEGGCPWDLEQDFETISPHTIEEAYEVDEAIASGDAEALRDELGDLLFQVVFQARIAEERGLFDFAGVVEAISTKLVRRHPHVFAEAEAPTSAGEQLRSWEEIKAAERSAMGKAEDPFEGIPRRLPALARSAKIAGRLARQRPEPDAAGAAEAIRIALDALVAPPSAEAAGRSGALLERIGEGLRAWVALARALGVDAERALREADDRVIEHERPV